jgi:hypothetical protein
VAIEARTGSKTKRWVGLVLLLAGSGGALVSLGAYSIASKLGPDRDGTYATRDADRIYAGALGLSCVALAILGISLLASHTEVEIH